MITIFLFLLSRYSGSLEPYRELRRGWNMANVSYPLHSNERVDHPGVENTGTGYVDYMDIGAVERQ